MKSSPSSKPSSLARKRSRWSVTSVEIPLKLLLMWYTRFVLLSFKRYHLISFVLFGSFTFKLSTCTTKTLGLPDLSPRLRTKCLSALFLICSRQALLPRLLQIPICYNRSDPSLCQGGFADVWKGEHEGRRVAVKVLRVGSPSSVDKIKSVSVQSSVKIQFWPATLTHVDILQGGCDVERSLPSKCTSTFRHYDGEKPIRNGIRMDGEWKYQWVRQSALGSESIRACAVSFLLFTMIVVDNTHDSSRKLLPD